MKWTVTRKEDGVVLNAPRLGSFAAGRSPRRMIGRAFALTVGVALAIAAATVFVHFRNRASDIGVLKWSGAGSAGMSQWDIPVDGHVSIGGLVICVTTDHAATIISVEPISPSAQFSIAAWGVRPNPFATAGRPALGAERVPLSAFPDFTHAEVSGHCDDIAHGSELAVEATKPTAATAKTDGLLIRYRIDEMQGSTELPFAIVLCGPGDHGDHCK